MESNKIPQIGCGRCCRKTNDSGVDHYIEVSVELEKPIVSVVLHRFKRVLRYTDECLLNTLHKVWPAYVCNALTSAHWLIWKGAFASIWSQWSKIVDHLKFLYIFCFVQIAYGKLTVIILKQAAHDFLEEKNELPHERALVCDNNWLFNLAFLVDVSNHLNDLNMKLKYKNKLFPVFTKRYLFIS